MYCEQLDIHTSVTGATVLTKAPWPEPPLPASGRSSAHVCLPREMTQAPSYVQKDTPFFTPHLVMLLHKER